LNRFKQKSLVGSRGEIFVWDSTLKTSHAISHSIRGGEGLDRRKFIICTGQLIVLGVGNTLGLSGCGQQTRQLITPPQRMLDESNSPLTIPISSDLVHYSHTNQPKPPRKPYPTNAPAKFKKVVDFRPEANGLTVAQATELYANKKRKKMIVTDRKGGQTGWYLLAFDRYKDGERNQYLYVCSRSKGEERFSYLVTGAGSVIVNQDMEIMWLYHQTI
jgi:hypothetical protein